MRFVLSLTLVLSLSVFAYAAPQWASPVNPNGGTGDGPIASGDVIFDNIGPNGGLNFAGSSPASQLDVIYPFDAGAADNFVLDDTPEGKWLVTGVQWSGVYLGEPISPSGFNIIIWPDDGSGTAPVGGTPEGQPPDYSEALYIQTIQGDANQTPNDQPDGIGFDYFAEIDPKHLLPGIQYWLEVQPIFNSPPQWFWQVTNGKQGAGPVQGFAIDLPDFPAYWTPISDPGDLAFRLIGKAVPEPAGLLLLGCGALALLRRRR